MGQFPGVDEAALSKAGSGEETDAAGKRRPLGLRTLNWSNGLSVGGEGNM